MTKQKIEYKWETLGINKFKQVRKSEGITAAKLKKEYWFTAKQRGCIRADVSNLEVFIWE